MLPDPTTPPAGDPARLPAPVTAALAEVRHGFYAAAAVVLAAAAALRVGDAPRGLILIAVLVVMALSGYGHLWTRHVARSLTGRVGRAGCVHAETRFAVLTRVVVENGDDPTPVWCWGRATWAAESVTVHDAGGGPLVLTGPHRGLVAVAPSRRRAAAAAPTRRVGRNLGPTPRRADQPTPARTWPGKQPGPQS